MARRSPLRMVLLVVAVISTLAGAVIAILPALALALVHLFYDSAGGVLILLGNLLMLLPHPALPATPNGSPLPLFRMLEDHIALVLFRSVGGAMLCSIAFILFLRDQWGDWRLAWLTTGSCLAAALLAGERTAIALLPAIAASMLSLIRPRVV